VKHVETPTNKTLTGRLRDRLSQSGESMRFARKRAANLRDSLRLYYHLDVKPSLAFRRVATYSPDRILSFDIRTASGRVLQVRARDNGVEVGTILEFFSRQSGLAPADLPPFQPKVIYDLGANIGVASLYFSSLYPDAEIYGFEPMPANYEVCALNYRNLSKGRAFPWAVGARTGTAIFECLNDPRGSRLQGGITDPPLRTERQIEVQVYAVADLVRQQKLAAPDFLKIDVEGAELDVLAGLGDCAGAVQRIFVETHGPDLKAGCLKWLQERGFRIWQSADPTAIWGHRA